MTMTMRSEASWSLLDPRPVCFYDQEYDAHLVYWNGVLMTRTYAVMIYSNLWLNMYATRSMKKSAWEEYNRVYRSGGFRTREWDSIVDSFDENNFHNQLINFINKGKKHSDLFLNRLRSQYTAQEALSWFFPGKERSNVVES